MVQHCQTFLWGGEGVANYDDVNSSDFTCDCEDGVWSDFNILGRPSCVPTKAHLVFGAIGLATSMAGMLHAAYQLNRQITFHRHQMAASASPIEQARRHLHIVPIAHAGVGLVYFTMVIWLSEEHQWVSVILLAGVSQITASIGGILTLRMWIYTNDPRLVRETPEILAISEALEKPVGQCTAYGVACIGGVVGTILAAFNNSHAAVKVAAVSFMFLCVGCNLLIWRCGTVLMATIDKSLQNSAAANSEPNSQVAAAPEAGGERANRSGTAASGGKKAGGGAALLAARKKIKTAMSICLSMGFQTVVMLTFAVASSYGTAVPLLFFGVPLGLAPSLWFIFNIQMHAGRSKLRPAPGARSAASSGHNAQQTLLSSARSMLNKSILSRSQHIVLPTENPT